MSRFRDDEMVSGKLVNQQDNLIKDLERQLDEAREVQNKLGEWVHQYIHCMRTVDYCGSLEEANEMGRYLEKLKEKGE